MKPIICDTPATYHALSKFQHTHSGKRDRRSRPDLKRSFQKPTSFSLNFPSDMSNRKPVLGSPTSTAPAPLSPTAAGRRTVWLLGVHPTPHCTPNVGSLSALQPPPCFLPPAVVWMVQYQSPLAASPSPPTSRQTYEERTAMRSAGLAPRLRHPQRFKST